MLELFIFGNTIKNYLISLSIILLFIAGGKIFSSVILGIVKSFVKKTQTVADDILISVVEKPLIFAIFIAGFYYSTSYLNFGVSGKEIIGNITEVLIVLNIIWAITKFSDSLIEHYLLPLVKKSESQIDDQLMPFARKFVKVLIVIMGLIFLISSLGYDVTSLVAGLGIGGLAFALAAQPLLTNLFGGLSIIADKPFHLGDRIRVDQQHEGVVCEIGMRSTVIETANNTKLTIPNSVIAASVIENLSKYNDHATRVTFNIGLTYDTPNAKIRRAIDIINKILDSNKYVVKKEDLAPKIVFNEMKDSSLNIYVAYSFIAKLPHTNNLRTEINLSIKEEFEKEGIDFAFPTQTVHVKNR